MINTIQIIIDESGAMHNPKDRYFIVGGFVTSNFMACRSHQKLLEKKYKDKYNTPLASEVKGSSLRSEDTIDFNLSYIAHEHIRPIAIVVDKKHVKKRLEENLGYNYYTGLLIRSLVTSGIIDCESCDEIRLCYDNRTLKLDARHDLGAYIEHALAEVGFMGNFIYESKDSAHNAEIRIADIICNTMYKVYQKRDRIIEDKLDVVKHYFVNPFPRYNFRK